MIFINPIKLYHIYAIIIVSYILNYNMKGCVKMSEKRLKRISYIPLGICKQYIIFYLTRLEQNDMRFMSYELCVYIF